MTTAAIIVAAGRGSRFGADIPKQYVPLEGPCALRRSVEAFLKAPCIDRVIVVRNPDDAALYEAAMEGLNEPALMPPVAGGATRGASVCAGLEALDGQTPSKVLIHDAARPFVSDRIIAEVIAALDDTPGAFAALPLVDAIWKEDAGHADHPVPRDGLWRAQTPQGFQFQAILNAHRAHDGQGLDDVAVAREAGLAVKLIRGDGRNFKITTPEDLDRALREVRTGGAGL